MYDHAMSRNLRHASTFTKIEKSRVLFSLQIRFVLALRSFALSFPPVDSIYCFKIKECVIYNI